MDFDEKEIYIVITSLESRIENINNLLNAQKDIIITQFLKQEKKECEAILDKLNNIEFEEDVWRNIL